MISKIMEAILPRTQRTERTDIPGNERIRNTPRRMIVPTVRTILETMEIPGMVLITRITKIGIPTITKMVMATLKTMEVPMAARMDHTDAPITKIILTGKVAMGILIHAATVTVSHIWIAITMMDNTHPPTRTTIQRMLRIPMILPIVGIKKILPIPITDQRNNNYFKKIIRPDYLFLFHFPTGDADDIRV